MIERQVNLEVKDGKLVGYAVIYNRWSETMALRGKPFRELIKPNAVELAGEVLADIGHGQNHIIGRLSRGTLKTKIDDKGLYVIIDPPDNGIYDQVERGDYEGMSFRADIPKGGSSWRLNKEDNILEHVISRMVVNRVSVVAEPAYKDTVVIARELPNDAVIAEQVEQVGKPADADSDTDTDTDTVVTKIDHTNYYKWQMKKRNIVSG